MKIKTKIKTLTISLVFIFVVGLLFPFTMTAEPAKIVLWHSYRGTERAALEAVGELFKQKHPEIQLQFLQVPYDAFADKITAAIPRGKGPDVFIFGHDRIGDWVARDSLEPVGLWVTEDIKKQFLPICLEALTFEDALYGLPTAIKCTALIYNKKLIPTPPKDTAELIKMGQANTDAKAGKFGLVYENGLTYYNSAWLFGFGGGIFDDDDNPIVNSEGNVKALTFAYALLRTHKIMPEEISNTLVTSLFNQGQAAMAISGPWLLGEIDKKIDYAVAPLPFINEAKSPAKPFLTAEALIMSSKCKDKKAAFEVMKFFSGPEAAFIMATKGNQPVANLSAYEKPEVKSHPFIPIFKKQAENAVPMPNIPEMNMVWTPFDLAIGKVLNNTASPKEALDEAQKKVETSVKQFRGE